MNLNINFRDVNSKPLSSRKVLFTPVKSPEISASYLSVADSYQFITDVTGSIYDDVVAGIYKVDIANPKPETLFYLNVNNTGSNVYSGSYPTGSSQFVFFDLINLVKDPFSIRKVSLTPVVTTPYTFSSSYIAFNSTSSLTDGTGYVEFDAVVPGIVQVDCFGKVDTTFYISVPSFPSSGAFYSPQWNAKDLLVVKPTKAIPVRLNNADSSYVLTVSSSDARYAPKYTYATSSTALSASHADFADSASYAFTASYALNVPESASFALTASLAYSSSYATVALLAISTSVINNTVLAESASWASSSVSSSYSLYADTAGVALGTDPILPSYHGTMSFLTHINADGNIYNTGNSATVTDEGNIYAKNVIATASLATTASNALTASYLLGTGTITHALSADYAVYAGFTLSTESASYAASSSYSEDQFRISSAGNTSTLTIEGRSAGGQAIDLTSTPAGLVISSNTYGQDFHGNFIGNLTGSLNGSSSWSSNSKTASIARKLTNDTSSVYFDPFDFSTNVYGKTDVRLNSDQNINIIGSQSLAMMSYGDIQLWTQNDGTTLGIIAGHGSLSDPGGNTINIATTGHISPINIVTGNDDSAINIHAGQYYNGGQVNISGSEVNIYNAKVTGSLLGTASLAEKVASTSPLPVTYYKILGSPSLASAAVASNVTFDDAKNLFGTASWANNTLTASSLNFVPNTASYSSTASYAINTPAALSSSHSNLADTSSWSINSITSSYSSTSATASYVDAGNITTGTLNNARLPYNFLRSDAYVYNFPGSFNLRMDNQILTMSFSTASATNDGFISSTDWNTFNNKTKLTTGSTYPITASNIPLVTVNSKVKMGLNAGLSTLISTNAVQIGNSAGQGSVSASSAVQIGDGAGLGTYDASQAVQIGVQAGLNSTTASRAVQIGYAAGSNTTNAIDTVQIGFTAGHSSTNAQRAVQIGDGAGYNSYTASNSVEIGFNAGANSHNTTNAVIVGASTEGDHDSIAIGNQASASANQAVIGSTAITSTILRGNVIAAGGVTASLQGTASWALNVIGGSTGTSAFATQSLYSSQSVFATQSIFTTQSLYSTQSIFSTQSLFATRSVQASYATASLSSSWASSSISSSYTLTASYALNAGSGGTTLSTGSSYPITSSWSNNAISASYSVSSLTASCVVTTLVGSASWHIYSSGSGDLVFKFY